MRVFVLGLVIVFFSCSSSKKVLNAAEIADFKSTIENKKLEITANSANPQAINAGVTGLQNLMPPGSSIANINLNSIPNFFKINQDSLAIDLPYYGQQQLSKSYNSTDIGVLFNGKAELIKQEYNKKKNSYLIKYRAKAVDENYQIALTLYPNNIARFTVISSHRTSISYNGVWKEQETNP
ncbi:MAG: DUF4251 domain-containing protein [Polaribacter sp.]